MPVHGSGAPRGRATRSHIAAAPAEKPAAAHTVRHDGDPVPLADAVAGLVSLSDYLDRLLRLRLAAWREGYAAAELAHADDYDRGFHDGRMAVKRAQHDAVDLCELEGRRWELRGEPRTRQTFGLPHPDDYQGGAA